MPLKGLAGELDLERRGNARRAIHLPLLLSWRNGIKPAQSVDLSDTGMRIECDADPPPGTRLIIGLDPSFGIETLHAEGRVVWLGAPPTPSGLYTWGFHFDTLNPQAAAYLRDILTKHPGPGQSPQAAADALLPGATLEKLPTPADLQRAFESDRAEREKKRRDADALVRAAAEACTERDYATAEFLLTQALGLVSDSRAIMEELGHVVYLRGDIVRAGELFDRALRFQQEK
jgi:hypothetical protein